MQVTIAGPKPGANRGNSREANKASVQAAIRFAVRATILTSLIVAFPSRLPADVGVQPTPGNVSESDPGARQTIDINAADAEALAERLPGVGPVKAARIVAYRQQHGPFAMIDDLISVPGIGPVTLERIREFVTERRSTNEQPVDGQPVREAQDRGASPSQAQPLSTTERDGQARVAVQALKALALRDAEQRGTGTLDW